MPIAMSGGVDAPGDTPDAVAIFVATAAAAAAVTSAATETTSNRDN